MNSDCVGKRMTKDSKLQTNKLKSICCENKGTTMVETIVAFVVLIIILLVVVRIVAYCSSLRMKAVDTDKVVREFNSEIYKTPDQIDSSEVTTESYVYKAEDGPEFYLMLDYDNTEMMEKNVKDSATDYPNYKLRMNKTEATCFKSVNPLIESEQLVTPKVLSFRYKE